MKDCGCQNKNKDGTPQFLMVAASPTEAATCGTKEASSGGRGCVKGDSTYDETLTSFVIPIEDESVMIRVCNGNLYAIGQWIEFLSPRVKLRISAISGNELTLRNRCDNGLPVSGNPSAGQAITSRSKFVSISSPNCSSNNEDLEQIQETLSDATQLCLTGLEETNDTTTSQIVGRIESDTSDTGVRKCVKRIKGFFFKDGSPMWPSILTQSDNFDSFRRLVVNKATGAVRSMLNYGEWPNLENGKQYTPSARAGGPEYLVGPSYVPCLFTRLLKEYGNIEPLNPIVITANPSPYEENISLAGIPEITNLVRSQDHYYVMIHMIVFNSNNSNVIYSLNDEIVCISEYRTSDSAPSFESIVFPVRVENNVNNIKFSARRTSGPTASLQFAGRLTIKGVYA